MKLPHSYIPFYIIKFFISTFAINDVKLKLTWNYVLYNSKRICWYVLSIFPQGKIKDNILVLLQYFPTLSNFIYSLKTFQDKYIRKMLFCFMLHSIIDFRPWLISSYNLSGDSFSPISPSLQFRFRYPPRVLNHIIKNEINNSWMICSWLIIFIHIFSRVDNFKMKKAEIHCFHL